MQYSLNLPDSPQGNRSGAGNGSPAAFRRPKVDMTEFRDKGRQCEYQPTA
ncbi:MAG: hypothetical protein GY841_00805 [FCB group bacterium]|nr:hypothetical protein [FCB group bacterium]